MEWNEYWEKLITENKLTETVKHLNFADEEIGLGFNYTEKICEGIYYKFIHDETKYSNVKSAFLELIYKIPNIHSIGNRVKEIDSLLVKVITKRAEKFNSNSPYVTINESDFEDIITDLIGIRLVLHYQGQWYDVHRQLVELFPEDKCQDGKLLPHENDKMFMAEFPIAYHAPDDDVSQFEGIIRTKPHNKGYRSNHYIISFQNVYIELQVRTIYDEAWSDFDHTYVYKKEANPNNDALKVISPILCKITNAASDIGEFMRTVYEELLEVDDQGKFVADAMTCRMIEAIRTRLHESTKDFELFCEEHIAKK